MTAEVMRAMRTLLSLVAASPPVRTPSGGRNDPSEWRSHQRRPERRQEQPQAVPEGREERNAVSTGALLMEGAEGGATWGVPEMDLRGSWRLALQR